MKTILVFALTCFSMSLIAGDGYKASDGKTYPWCTDNAIDPDNDGWGWENEASCKVPGKVIDKPADEVANGVDEMPKGYDGLPVYGEGRTCGKYGVLGKGRGRVCCSGDFFAEDDDDEVTYVARTPKGRYFAEAGSSSCARNKVIMRCAFENPLAICESNARKWY